MIRAFSRITKEARLRRYIYVALLTGIVVFFISQITGSIHIRGTTFEVDALLVEIAGTLISISALTLLYYIAGEEPTVQLIKSLINMQGAARVLHDAGILQFERTRDSYNISEMHTRFAAGQSAFIVSRNFNAFEYARVRDLFRTMLIDKRKTLKLLVRSDTTRKVQFQQFLNELPPVQRSRMEIRCLDVVMLSMYGNESCIYATYNLESASGSESPTLLCSHSDNNTAYSIFEREFRHLWNSAQPL
jgi:hypothetical protein